MFAVRSVLLDEFIDRYFPAPIEDPPALPTAKAHAKLAHGWYRPSDTKASFFRLVTTLDQAQVTTDADGTIAVSNLRTIGGTLRRWREVAPFIWQEVGGRERLTMAASDGRVTRIARTGDVTDVLLRVGPLESAGWLIPVLAGSALILVIAGLSWPAGAWLRWRYRVRDHLTTGVNRIRRAAQVTVGLDLVFVGCWILLFHQLGAGRADVFSERLDPWLRIVQAIGLLGALGTIVLVIDAVLALRHDRSWAGRAFAVVVALAGLGFTWGGVATGLLSQSLRY